MYGFRLYFTEPFTLFQRLQRRCADLSEEALEVARKNAEQLGESSALFVQGDLFAPVEGSLRLLYPIRLISAPM